MPKVYYPLGRHNCIYTTYSVLLKKHLHIESPMLMIMLYVDLTDCWKNAYKPALEIGKLPHIY